MFSGGGYVSNLGGGAVTISQTNNATSRNEIAVAVFSTSPASASAWNVAGSGSWETPGNWTNAVPSGTGAIAQFSQSDPTTAAAVTLDAAITLNQLAIGNSNQITIGPGSGGSLTFAASGATLPGVNVVSGSQIISAPVSLNNNTTFTIAFGQELTVGANIANGTATSGITINSLGTLVLGGNNSYSGTTSVTGGVLNVTVNLGNTPVSMSGGAMSLSGTLGNVPVSVSGAGVLNVSGLLTSSTASVSGGALNVTGNLGNSPVTVTGGMLSLQSPGAVSQNVVTINGGALVETASNAMSGTARLTVSAGASATLSQANNYSGLTKVNGGTLQAAMAGSLYGGNSASWTPANISVSGSGTLVVNIGGPNDFTDAQASALLANLSTVNSNGLTAGASFGFDTTNSGTATATFGGPITDSTGPGGGRLSIKKLGVGVLSLNNTSNSYSGPTLVSNGELILNGANTATAGTVSTITLVNTVGGNTSILSLRNSGALGSGAANSGLVPIIMNATGGNLSSSILEIGATIGTDPGPNNADFSYFDWVLLTKSTRIEAARVR